MDFQVVFSPTSIRDLAESVSYIARHDPDAAARVGDKLIDDTERMLSQQPLVGPRCPEFDSDQMRYWLRGNYRVIYEVHEDQKRIDVLRFWHCARGDLPIEATGG